MCYRVLCIRELQIPISIQIDERDFTVPALRHPLIVEPSITKARNSYTDYLEHAVELSVHSNHPQCGTGVDREQRLYMTLLQLELLMK